MHPMQHSTQPEGGPIRLRSDLSECVAYDQPGFLSYIRDGLLSTYPNYAALCHWHEDIELIYILDGYMDYHINGKVVRLHKGDGLFVNSRQLHYGFSQSHEECTFICILLHPTMLCASSLLEEQFVLPIIRRSSLPYLVLRPSVDWQEEINGLIREIFALREQAHSQMRILSCHLRLWDVLRSHLSETEETTNAEAGDLMLIRSMMQYIDRGYTEKLSMNGIAAAAHVSVSKCYHLFHLYLGQTPLEYITRFRLEKSIELLRAGDRKITDVALQVGFSGASYFAETFRKYYGCSPSDYRGL